MRHDMWKTVAALGTWSLLPRSFVATFGTLSRRGTERCRAGHGTWSLILRSFVAHTSNSTSKVSIACCDKVPKLWTGPSLPRGACRKSVQAVAQARQSEADRRCATKFRSKGGRHRIAPTGCSRAPRFPAKRPCPAAAAAENRTVCGISAGGARQSSERGARQSSEADHGRMKAPNTRGPPPTSAGISVPIGCRRLSSRHQPVEASAADGGHRFGRHPVVALGRRIVAGAAAMERGAWLIRPPGSAAGPGSPRRSPAGRTPPSPRPGRTPRPRPRAAPSRA
jgi:hypothetical protein